MPLSNLPHNHGQAIEEVLSLLPHTDDFTIVSELFRQLSDCSRIRIFWQVIFPEILPAALTGFGLAFGRCLGEYGSVVFIAGNQPYETEITPLIIMSKLQEYDYTSATSIALVMLVAAFLILFLTNLVQSRSSKILKGGQ